MTFLEILKQKMDYQDSIPDEKKETLFYIQKSIKIITDSMRRESDQEYLNNLDSNISRLESLIDILKEKNATRQKN